VHLGTARAERRIYAAARIQRRFLPDKIRRSIRPFDSELGQCQDAPDGNQCMETDSTRQPLGWGKPGLVFARRNTRIS
jgi:hypothetical protein